MCACMYVRAYVCVCACMCARMYVFVHVCVRACMCACMYVRPYVCVRVCIYVCVYICKYVCDKVFHLPFDMSIMKHTLRTQQWNINTMTICNCTSNTTFF